MDGQDGQDEQGVSHFGICESKIGTLFEKRIIIRAKGPFYSRGHCGITGRTPRRFVSMIVRILLPGNQNHR